MTGPEIPKVYEKANSPDLDDLGKKEADPELRRRERLKELREAEENERYQERVLIGEVDSEEAAQKFSHALEDLKADPKLLTKISPHLIEHLWRAAKVSKKEKATLGQFPARYEAELDNMTLAKKAELFVITTNKKFVIDDADFKNFDQEVQKILTNYVVLGKKEQLAIVSVLKEKWQFRGDAELLRKMMIVNAKESGDIAHMKIFVRDEKAMGEYVKLVEEGEGHVKAFEEAVKQGSPELQKNFQDYFQQWQSPSVSDVFPKNPPPVAGVKVEMPSSDQVLSAVAAYQQEGIHIDISPDSHAGIVYIGDAIMREAAIYRVDGVPKFFIYDHNADEGVRGPFDPMQAQEVFFEISIDDYFSRKFREFSTHDSEKDPTKVADNKLLKMAHAFFPLSELRGITLDIHTRQLLDNLAYLCVIPDEHYITMSEKIKFFDRIINDPLSSWSAKTLLQEKNFTQSTLSNFEVELRELAQRGAGK